MAELVDEELQGYAILKRVTDSSCEAVHEAGDSRAFFRHGDEQLTRRAVVVKANGKVSFMTSDGKLMSDGIALIGEFPADGPEDDPFLNLRGRSSFGLRGWFWA